MKQKLSFVLALLLLLTLVASACAAPVEAAPPVSTEAVQQTAPSSAPAEADKPDLQVDMYFENGIIYTADANDSLVEALAVSDGRIIFAGSADEGAPYKAAAGEVVDLKGNMMMPGLIDGHIHSLTPEFFDFSLVGILTLEETMQTIKDYVDANPDKETFFGFGYMATLFEGKEQIEGPQKERLDAICPDKPMVIYSYDGHAAWLNSKGLEYCGVSKDTKSVPGGRTVRDENGELWGILHDADMSFTNDFPLDPETVAAALQNYIGNLSAMGYTSIMSPAGNGFFPLPMAAYQKLADEGKLNIRVRCAPIVTSWKTEQDLATLKTLKETYNNDNLKVIGAKLFIDGVADNESAYLLEPYSDKPGYSGVSGWEPDALKEAVTTVNKMGLLAHMHSMGDGATHMALNAIEYSQGQNGRSDYRNALTHLQLISPEDLPRFGELNVVAVANPYWHYKAPGYWELKEHVALGERAEHEYPMKSFLDNGAVLAFASDYPVTVDPRPFVAIETGITRNLPDGSEYGVPDITDMNAPDTLLWPEERLDVLQMLRGFTIDAAYAIFEEQETGSLEVGKSADMIIIDKNLLTADPLTIKNTNVLSTYLHGKLVYDGQ